MKKAVFMLGCVLAAKLWAFEDLPDDGVTFGRAHFNADAAVRAAHDTRVVRLGAGEYGSDTYAEAEAGVAVENLPARYRASAAARYGYRSYSEFSEINDDFYAGNFEIKTTEEKLNFGFRADVSKALEYRTAYDPNTGDGPDAVLTDSPNLRVRARAEIGYEMFVSDKLSVLPRYQFEYYHQWESDGAGEDIARWQIHRAVIESRYHYSDKTVFSVGLAGSQQNNEDENGTIVTAFLRGESRLTEKTFLNAAIGISSANYEETGSAQSFVSDINFNWNATEKVSAYTFLGNRFLPGYRGGSPRMVVRAGYGFNWRVSALWRVGGRGAHGYDYAVSDVNTDQYGGVSHFYNLYCRYQFLKRVALTLEGAYTNDEIEVDRWVGSLGIEFAY